MSKLQPVPEVPLSIDARRRPTGRWAPLGALTAALVAGCLTPGSGDATSDVALSDTDSGTEGSAGGSTLAPVMTTTEEPETSSDSSSSAASDSSTTGVPVGCGDGMLQAPEECDYGNDNTDDGECTSDCRKATCGDGKIHAGVEVCDDGVNDGAYGGCVAGCAALAPHCGDGEIQGSEACDEADPKDGCLVETCQFAASCRQIRDAFLDEKLTDGVYTIKPADKSKVQVWCDMDADGGGYTFLKIALPEGQEVAAKQAEAKCAEFGMQLLIPRTERHLEASILAAKSILLDPIGGGTTKDSMEYMAILGIYPVTPGLSCVGKAINNVDCPEWQPATGSLFFVSPMEQTFGIQPLESNCAGCSMRYTWSEVGMLTGIEAFSDGGKGAKSGMFMCDTGDKQQAR